MLKLTLSWLIKTIRPYSNDPKLAYQFLLSDLCSCFVSPSFFVESTASSRIMNNEYDVPQRLRDTFIKRSESEVSEMAGLFLQRHMEASRLDQLIASLKGAVRDSAISSSVKALILSESDASVVFGQIVKIAALSDNRVSINKVLYQNGDSEIRLISGDLIALGLNKKLVTGGRIVVIPVDEDFTMKLGEAISKDSIHGKWISRMQKDGVSARAIKKRIKYAENAGLPKIGKISYGETEFYLAPVSKLGERNRAESSLEMLDGALDAVVREYDVSGQGNPLYIPLMGTGRSRNRLSMKASIDLIAKKFMGFASGLHGIVNIVVYSKDKDKKEVRDYAL